MSETILGVGNDLIEIERIRESIERQGLGFLDRLFTQEEQNYCAKFHDPYPHYAGRFAAKEAIAKAFGTGFGAELSWVDLEILNDEKGRPIVYFSHLAQERFQKPKVHLSISHSKGHATAVAIWVG